MSQADLDNKLKIGERIRAERKRLGYNQTDFANAAGIELATQSRYETAKQRPKLDYLFSIASFGADTQFILTGQRSSGDALTSKEAALIDHYRSAGPSTQVAVEYLLASAVSPTNLPDVLVSLPSEDALARMFQAMLLPLDLGDALEETARTFAQQLPASLDAAGPGHPPQYPAATPAPDTRSPTSAKPHPAS
ncbi:MULTISPECIES: helix-turn-helix domain-containing protein [unclassified Sphingomonas]|uniref:helix-turn-helix domain-containing protein n=1 Tax=unclassified Sphingomonas TaxID=196159 RepID=UPI0012E1070E|nr:MULTISPECIES: helix-turn-helix domain-containing protein [unclassified Sphingomonas]